MGKLICATPAGRRRYMKLLVPQILSSPIVERYDIWLNTTNEGDLAFFHFLANKYDKVRLIPQPDGKVDGNSSINAFFKNCIEEDACYVRLDDDIVWIMPGFFEAIYANRLQDPAFLLTPLVINNAVCTHVLQQKQKFPFKHYLRADCFDSLAWQDPKFAYQLHLWFLDFIENNAYSDLLTSDHYVALNRFSINAISWKGLDFKTFDGVVLGDDEEYLSVIKPAELNRYNKILGNLLVAHYGFFTQRAYLDSTDLLDRYEKATRKTYAKNSLTMQIFEDLDAYFKTQDDARIPPKQEALVKNIKNFILDISLPTIQFKTIRDIRKG